MTRLLNTIETALTRLVPFCGAAAMVGFGYLAASNGMGGVALALACCAFVAAFVGVVNLE